MTQQQSAATSMPNQAHMWFQTFGQTGKDGGLSPCETPEALQAILQNRGSRGVVIYMRPAQVIAQQVRHGLGVGHALETWCQAAQGILDVQSRHRSRVVLLELSETLVASADPAVTKALAGMAIPAVPSPVPEQDLVAHETVAKMALGLDPKAMAMLDMLQAATTGGYEELAKPVDQLDALLLPLQDIEQLKSQAVAQERAYQEVTANYDAVVAAKAGVEDTVETLLQTQVSAEAKHDLLAGQLSACESALKAAESKYDTTAADLKAAKAESDAQAKRHAEAETKAQALCELVATQLEACKSALKGADATSKVTAAALRKAEAEALSVQQASTQKIAVLAQQVEGLEKQCRAADQALGSKTAEMATLTKAHKAALAAQTQETAKESRLRRILEEQVVGLQQPLLQSEAGRQQCLAEKIQLDAHYRKKVAELSDMLDALHKSTSWRMTGPARSVMRRIRR